MWRCRCPIFRQDYSASSGMLPTCWHIKYLKETISETELQDLHASTSSSLDTVDDLYQALEEDAEHDSIEIDNDEDVIEINQVTQNSSESKMYRNIITRAEQNIEDMMRMRSGRTATATTQDHHSKDDIELTEWVFKIPNLLLWVVPYGRGNHNTFCWVWWSKVYGGLKCKCRSPSNAGIHFLQIWEDNYRKRSFINLKKHSTQASCIFSRS